MRNASWMVVAVVGGAAACGGPGAAELEPNVTPHGTTLGLKASILTEAEARGRDIWFENTYGGERFFSLVLPYNPDPTKRLRVGFEQVVNTPRAERFDTWGVINDPDCVANPGGGRDLCDDPESSGVIGIRYKGPSPAGDGTDAFGVTCAACHAGFDPLEPPTNPNDPSWDNVHATIGNQYLKFGSMFAANLAPDDVRGLMFKAWPDGAVDTTLLFSDNIMNPGTVTAFWEHDDRKRFDVGLEHPVLRNGQGGEDDVGDLATVRVYTNIGVCFFECVSPALASEQPVDVETCRQQCADFPPQQDLDDVTAFLGSFEAPQLEDANGLHKGGDSARYNRGRRVFERTCAGCHERKSHLREVLSSDALIPLASDPDNNTNSCRSKTTNWQAGEIWAQFSSDRYKSRVQAGNRGYRVMPLAGVWATTPFMHNQSIGEYAPAAATPDERATYFERAMWELLSSDRTPVVHTLDVPVGPFPVGTPLAYVFSRDPDTGELLCDDVVENRGHYYGAELPDDDKSALVEWLKYQ